MRIEGISEGSASPFDHAFEHHAPVRAFTHQSASRPTAHGIGDIAAEVVVVDTHDSAAPPPPRQEVEFTPPHRLIAMSSEQRGVIDRNGDGMINLRDLPFDYFQIARQTRGAPIAPPPPDRGA